MNKFLDFPKFIIYGTGIKTKEFIEIYNDKVHGLMDENYTHEFIYGKHVMNEDEIIKSKIKVIVIVARKVNIPIIYRRIKSFCIKNGIVVYDIDGNVVATNDSKENISFELDNLDEIKDKIKKADVVSFDIFDTLIIRSCLYPNDVFEIAGTYDLELNYEVIFQTEYDMANQRKEIVSLYNFAKLSKKEVYFVTDMYLTSISILKLLQKCGINTELNKIIVSSEHGTDKSNDLFGVLINKCGNNKKIVHLGDCYEADYVAAKKRGLDAIRIESRLEILEKSKYSNMLKYDFQLENRLIIAELLKSSFDLVDLIAPFAYKFITWIQEQSKDLDVVFLGARDGWLIDLISRKIAKYNINSIYFLTSRSAAVSASLYSEKDIDEAKKYPFSGDLLEMYKKRFGLESIVSDCNLIKHSNLLRNNYLMYVEKLGIEENAKVGFVDLISSGTSYYSLYKFLPFKLYGLFALKLGDSDRKINSLYPTEESSKVISNYFALEEVFTSDMPTLKSFDRNGEAVYFEEKRFADEIKGIQKVHNKIIEYGNKTIGIDFRKVDLMLCDYIFGMFSVKDNMKEDEFCGR